MKTVHLVRLPLLLFLLACALRVLAVHQWFNSEEVKHLDSSEYVALAQNLRFHQVLSFGAPHRWGADGCLDMPGPYLASAARAPLYPLTIAALWWKSAPPIRAVLVLQILLGSAVALLVYYMAIDRFGPRCAAAAGFFMALGPLSIRTSAWLLTENLFIFLLTLGIWFWGRQKGFLAGLAFGAGALTRAVLFPFVFVLIVLATLWKSNRNLLYQTVLGAILVILPWTIRNGFTQHMFIPINVQGWGSNLLFATIDVPYGSGNPWPLYTSNPTTQQIIRSTSSESEAEREMGRVAIKRILANPTNWVWMRTKQYARLFTDSGTYFYFLPLPSKLIKITFLAGNFCFLMLSLLGVYRVRSRWCDLSHLLLFPAFLAIAQFPMLTDTRYALPLVPSMAIFAAYAITQEKQPPATPRKLCLTA